MIIICPCGEKKFEIDGNLIPDNGRLLKCGSCERTWFYKKDKPGFQSEENKLYAKREPKSIKKDFFDKTKKSKKIVDKTNEVIIYKNPKNSFTFGKFLSYLLVLLISFIGFIIILDTFKTPLYLVFPQLETFLYSFFETLKDIKLFIEDLID